MYVYSLYEKNKLISNICANRQSNANMYRKNVLIIIEKGKDAKREIPGLLLSGKQTCVFIQTQCV